MVLNPIFVGGVWFIIHRYSVFHTFIWRGQVGGLSQMKLTSFEKNCHILRRSLIALDVYDFSCRPLALKQIFKIPKGLSKPVNHRTDDTMPYERTKEQTMLQNIAQKTKYRVTRRPLKLWVNSDALEGSQFLLHMWHPQCYSRYE